MWGCLPFYRILNKNNAVLLFTDLLAPKIRSKLFLFILSDRALNGGLGLKDCQNVLPQPISPAFFDASLLLRYVAETSSTESKRRPQAFRTVVWLWYAFVELKRSMRDLRACDTIDFDHLLQLQSATEDLF